MIKHIKLLSSIFLFLALSVPAFCKPVNGGEEVKKKKLINRHFDVTADDKLEVDNQFGNVIVSTWDKSEITVDIEIGARASTDERAQEIMDEIDVKDYNSSHIISFKTKVGEIHNSKNNHNSDEDRAFYIDYIIHMPSANRLDLENSFGRTEVPNFKGLVTLTSKFGSLTTGKLENVDAIDVEFGKAAITEITNGKISFKFNKESKIGKVSGNVKISSEFSHNVQFNVSDKIEELTISESYSGVRVVVDKQLSASFDVHTSFGNFHNESDFTIREQKEDESDYGPHFDKDYNGKAGDGKARIKIKSSFGSVRLSHVNGSDNDDDKADDDKDKKKNKHKNKDKEDDDDKTT